MHALDHPKALLRNLPETISLKTKTLKLPNNTSGKHLRANTSELDSDDENKQINTSFTGSYPPPDGSWNGLRTGYYERLMELMAIYQRHIDSNLAFCPQNLKLSLKLGSDSRKIAAETTLPHRSKQSTKLRAKLSPDVG